MGAIDTLLVEVVAQVVVQEVVGQEVKAVVGGVTDKDNELMVWEVFWVRVTEVDGSEVDAVMFDDANIVGAASLSRG